jgi:DNA invertase Pin-like site-specific DNA recombinase
LLDKLNAKRGGAEDRERSSNQHLGGNAMTALRAAGCERIYREKAFGGRWDRPELRRLLDQLRKGDVLVVWKLDRLSRSLRDVVTVMERLAEAKAGFRRYNHAGRTNDDADGRIVCPVRTSQLRERTKIGLETAR